MQTYVFKKGDTVRVFNNSGKWLFNMVIRSVDETQSLVNGDYYYADKKVPCNRDVLGTVGNVTLKYCKLLNSY